MAKKLSDADVVHRILDEMEGKKNRLRADKIVRVLGPRIRKRARARESEDVNQAAARVVREATKD